MSCLDHASPTARKVYGAEWGCSRTQRASGALCARTARDASGSQDAWPPSLGRAGLGLEGDSRPPPAPCRLVSGIFQITKKNESTANAAYMPYVKVSENAASAREAHGDEEVRDPLRGRREAERLRADRGREDLAEEHPDQRTPRGAEADHEDVRGDERDRPPAPGSVTDAVRSVVGELKAIAMRPSEIAMPIEPVEQDGRATDAVDENDGDDGDERCS